MAAADALRLASSPQLGTDGQRRRAASASSSPAAWIDEYTAGTIRDYAA